jgi:hypothetical protein
MISGFSVHIHVKVIILLSASEPFTFPFRTNFLPDPTDLLHLQKLNNFYKQFLPEDDPVSCNFF